MKKVIFYFSGLLLCGALIVTSCKKKDTTPADDAGTQQENADDDARVQSESNSAADDANAALSGDGNVSGRLSAITATAKKHTFLYLVAGADSIVVDSTNTPATITIYYDGKTNVNGRTRSGSISIQLTTGTQWKDTNAVITLTFNNFVSTRIIDRKTLTISGSKTITNLTGGLVSKLGSSGYGFTTISHQIQTTGSGLTITFDNGKTVNWNTNRTRSITYVTTVSLFGIPIVREYRYTLSGDNTTQVPGSNVAWWGVNRNGENFNDIIVSPVVYDESIDWLGPISGKIEITGIAKTLTITYGVNSSGVPVSNPSATNQPYGYELNWTNLAGNAASAIIAY